MSAPSTTLTSPERRLLGGISSAFRVNPYTDGHLEVADAHGAHITTTDGRRFIDLFMAHGSTVLGHGHPAVMEAVRETLDDGVVIGYETARGEPVAEAIASLVPSAEAVRFVASGSEAVTTALRIARAVTGRDLVIKIDGHYHGGSDYAMVNSLAANTDSDNPGGRVSRRIPSSGGIPAAAVSAVVPIPWNDLDALDAALAEHAGRVAAVMMVPIDFNNGCIEPAEGYLRGATERAHAAGSLMIFDEVISVLKVAGGSAQRLYGVTPDLTAVSKALSSGVPLAGVVGRREYMRSLLEPAPSGPVQGGTYAGSALGLAAAQATLDIVTSGSFHDDMLESAERFFTQLSELFDRSPLPARVQWAGCMFHIYVGTREPVTSYADMRSLDPQLARRFFTRCIDAGLYFHTDFSVSAAHDSATLDAVLERIEAIVNAGDW